MKFSSVIYVAAISLLAFTIETQSGAAQIKPATKAPAAVTAAFGKAYPSATINNISKEMGQGTEFYLIESVDGQVQRNLIYTPAGEMVELGESIVPEALPDAIKKYLKEKHPKGVIIAGGKVVARGVTTYDIQVQNGKKKLNLLFDGNGKPKKK